jgi:hypothetical protein
MSGLALATAELEWRRADAAADVVAFEQANQVLMPNTSAGCQLRRTSAAPLCLQVVSDNHPG